MPRDAMDMETLELYKRNGYKDSGYHQPYHNLSYGEFCSMCGQNDYEEVTRNIGVNRKKTRNYEKHCPSCHCPPERRKCSLIDRRKTSENVEAMLNRYERVPAKSINSAIKKSQSSPLSPKAYWHDCQASDPPHCLKKIPPIHRHRRVKRDIMKTELTNEDLEAYSKYAQRIYPKSSLKKHNHCNNPEGSQEEQEYSDAESDVSLKYTQHPQYSRKSHVPNFGSRHYYIAGDDECVMKKESDKQGERECQEMRKLILGFQDYEKLKQDQTVATGENDKKNEQREIDIERAVNSKKSTIIKEPIGKLNKDITSRINCPAQLTKLNLHVTKNRIIESIDHILDAMDDTKKSVSRPEQMEQDTINKIAREIQENGWQFLFNALTIRRDSADSNKRIVRLECLNQMRRELDKLYALESTSENCPIRQSLSSHDTICNEEHQQSQQQSEQKIAES